MIYKAIIKNGKLGVPWQFAKENEGKEFHVELHSTERRNNSQNNLFWLRNRILARELGERQADLLSSYTKESVADLVKVMAFGYEEVKIGNQTFEIPKSSRDLPKMRFSDLIQTQDILARFVDPPIVLPS
jgi:hypothetical protein